MIIYKKTSDIVDLLVTIRSSGARIGFIPTMGALHQGHISLIKKAMGNAEFTICSIFVNPTQFNDPVDFQKYPATLEQDINLLELADCDLLFLPDLNEIYLDGTKNLPHYQLGDLENLLEGKYRKGHFQGVCQVVHRLLNIVHPDHLYLGQKDYQQCLVINKLIALFRFNTTTLICPTLREKDGLAMSSRNLRLPAADRLQAKRLFETLTFVKNEIRPGYLEDIKERAKQYLQTEGFKVDYVEIANKQTLEHVETWDGHQPLVALVAAVLNEVRLIDNILILTSY